MNEIIENLKEQNVKFYSLDTTIFVGDKTCIKEDKNLINKKNLHGKYQSCYNTITKKEEKLPLEKCRLPIKIIVKTPFDAQVVIEECNNYGKIYTDNIDQDLHLHVFDDSNQEICSKIIRINPSGDIIAEIIKLYSIDKEYELTLSRTMSSLGIYQLKNNNDNNLNVGFYSAEEYDKLYQIIDSESYILTRKQH